METRGCISVRGETYERVKAEADRRGVSVASLVDSWIAEQLSKGVRPPKRRDTAA